MSPVPIQYPNSRQKFSGSPGLGWQNQNCGNSCHLGFLVNPTPTVLSLEHEVCVKFKSVSNNSDTVEDACKTTCILRS